MNIEKGRKELINALNNVASSNNGDAKINLINKKIIDDDGKWYLSLSDEFGKITYAKSTEDKLSLKKRVKTSFRRFVRRQLDINSTICSDSWLDWFGCQVLSSLPYDINNKIVVLHGNDIVKFYTNTFIDTCMTGSENRKKIAFYANNPDTVGLAVLNNFVRAFIWLTDEGNYVFDRVYPSGNKDLISLFRKWAKAKGILLRTNPDSVVSKYETVSIDGGIINHVTMKINDQYPYLDTFRFGKFSDKKTVILSNSNSFGDMTFIRTNGLYYINKTCCACNNKIFEENPRLITNGYVCKTCWSARQAYCYQCDSVCDRIALSKTQLSMLKEFNRIYCDRCAKMYLLGA